MQNAHRISLLLVVLLQLAPGSCDKGARVSKFVSDNHGQSYFELKDDRGTHKVYSKEADGSALILVLDKKNVPEVIAIISDEKAYVMEYRPERGVPPAGLALIDAAYMKGIGSRNPAFAAWRNRLAVFKVSAARRSKTFKFGKHGLKPVSVDAGDNGIRVVALLNCDINTYSSQEAIRCAISPACRCAFHALCQAIDCYLRGDRDCFLSNLRQWEEACAALGEYQQGEGGDEGSLKDVGVDRVAGVYNLSY